MSSEGTDNRADSCDLNEAFIDGENSSGADTDISGFPSTISSIPSSLCSSELNKTMNDILGYLESEIKTLTGPEIPRKNENQSLPPLDHYRKFLPVYLSLEPPIIHQAQETAADGSETTVEIIVPRKQVSDLCVNRSKFYHKILTL